MALSVSEIKRLIDDDIASEKKRLAAVGQNYYEAKHDILKCRMFYYNADGVLVEDKTRSNIKICHPFFTELSDQHTAHLLSFSENPIRAKDNADGLQDHLDSYFNARFWMEIGEMITGSYNKGFEYLYAYKNKLNKLTFEAADSMGVVEVREKDTDDGCKYIIYHYVDRIDKGKKVIRRIEVWSEHDVTYYVQSGTNGRIVKDDTKEVNPAPHVVGTDEKSGKKMRYGLGMIPFFRFDNNRKQFSGLKPIKHLIDDYDLHACSLSNNLVDFDTPLYVVAGFQGENFDQLQQNLKTKKMVGVDSEGGLDVKTVDIPYQARKEKLIIDETNIYRFGMGFNSAQVGDGNITNIVIKSRYALLDMKTDKTQDRLCAFLEENIIPLVLDEINKETGKGYQMTDIRFAFTRDTVTNETENIQNEKVKAETKQIEVNTVLNVAANVGDEQTLKAICEIMDWDFEELESLVDQIKEEQDTANAKKTLEGVVTDEQKAEAGSAAILEQ